MTGKLTNLNVYFLDGTLATFPTISWYQQLKRTIEITWTSPGFIRKTIYPLSTIKSVVVFKKDDETS